MSPQSEYNTSSFEYKWLFTSKDEWIKSGTTKKRYSRNGDIINVEVKGSMVDWNEKIYYQDPNMIVEYSWLGGGYARQIFSKKTD